MTSNVEICILAGGKSNRFGGKDKALQLLDNKPFIMHVYERCLALDLPIKVFTHSTVQRIKLLSVLPQGIQVLTDQFETGGRTPLYGMLNAAQHASNPWVFIVPCDAIRLQPRLLQQMISCIEENLDAIVPRWPNKWIEPLIAIYSSSQLQKWIPFMLRQVPPELKLKLLLKHLDTVFYLSTEDLRSHDPDLATFVNVNSLLDLVPLLELSDPFTQTSSKAD